MCIFNITSALFRKGLFEFENFLTFACVNVLDLLTYSSKKTNS